MSIEQEALVICQREVNRLHARVNEEMRAKNEAYAFILESGLFEQFKEYGRLKICGDNPHQACCDWLDYEANRRRKQKQ